MSGESGTSSLKDRVSLITGSTSGIGLGIARALLELEPDLRGQLKAEGFLRRDAREKELRKYGLKKARKAPQYSKR